MEQFLKSPILKSFNVFLSFAKILVLNLKTYPVTLNRFFNEPYMEQSLTLPRSSSSTLLTVATTILMLLFSKLFSPNGKVISFGNQFLRFQARTVDHGTKGGIPNELMIWNELKYLLDLVRNIT